MSRDVRKVPPNWQHPKNPRGDFIPLHDQSFETAADEWKRGYAAWANDRPEACKDMEFWEYHGSPPERDAYRTYRDEEATWFQVYETVSEGTPVTPPFATKDELAKYLAEHGDFWDQNDYRRRPGSRAGWGVDRARAFVEAGSVPSLIVSGGQIFEAKDIALVLKK